MLTRVCLKSSMNCLLAQLARYQTVGEDSILHLVWNIFRLSKPASLLGIPSHTPDSLSKLCLILLCFGGI